MQKENIQIFGEYNRWINERIFAGAAKLSDTDLKLDRGAFFGSILGTLNHLMVGDIVWLKRFAASPENFASLKRVLILETPNSLAAELYDSLETLREAREELDRDIIAFCDEVSEGQLAEKLDYKNFKGDSYSNKLGLLAQHLFNHQTHHRGQVTTLLSQAGIDVGETDLLVCIRDL